MAIPMYMYMFLTVVWSFRSFSMISTSWSFCSGSRLYSFGIAWAAVLRTYGDISITDCEREGKGKERKERGRERVSYGVPFVSKIHW